MKINEKAEKGNESQQWKVIIEIGEHSSEKLQ